MNKNVFDGFTVNVFLDEDGDYLAHFVEMPNVSAFSNTPEDAVKELTVAWKGVKESYQKHNEPIPQPPSREGYVDNVNIVINTQLYRALESEAVKAGISLYALVTQKLGKPAATNDGGKSVAATS